MAFLSGAVVSLAFLFLPLNKKITQSQSASPPKSVSTFEKKQPSLAGLPLRIKIPKIKVDALVEQVGLTALGAMGTPENRADAAWYKFGPHPGDVGSAVIAGHYGWKNGKSSIFDNLHMLRAGDKIVIENDQGASISFVVRESRKYDLKADSSDVFISFDGKAHLNLITCEGTWNKITKTYSSRRVIFADKE